MPLRGPLPARRPSPWAFLEAPWFTDLMILVLGVLAGMLLAVWFGGAWPEGPQ